MGRRKKCGHRPPAEYAGRYARRHPDCAIPSAASGYVGRTPPAAVAASHCVMPDRAPKKVRRAAGSAAGGSDSAPKRHAGAGHQKAGTADATDAPLIPPGGQFALIAAFDRYSAATPDPDPARYSALPSGEQTGCFPETALRPGVWPVAWRCDRCRRAATCRWQPAGTRQSG
ncbi:hypothetical protein D3C75_1045650 [compost metagenome]